MEMLTNWGAGRTLAQGFRETRVCQRQVQALARECVRVPPGTPPAYRVSVGPLPPALGQFNRNIFSTLFHATYLLLGIPRPQRLLFGSMNQLFRIWVTSADNLLDGEDKLTLPLRMPGTSRVMRQVVAIMAADRILARLLSQAVTDGTVTPAEAALLSDRTLHVLLPSAAQEGTEEGGIAERPPSADVLARIHPAKTGMLFQLPFLGPETVRGTVDPDRLAQLKDALTSFGLGCQLLDDVRDVARDWIERRHNYVLSLLAEGCHPLLELWARQPVSVADRLYVDIPQIALDVARMGLDRIETGLADLRAGGLRLGAEPRTLSRAMLQVLDLEDLQHALER
jgi:hypothetical protein